MQDVPDVQPLLECIRDGVALYGRLGELLLAEREALTRHDLAGVRSANAEREVLLDHIAAWERQVADLLGGRPSPEGAASTLGHAVSDLPAPYRSGGEVALAALREAAETAHHRAAVNHILLERNRDTVERTLDILTGQRSGVTYGPGGDKARGASRGLVERKG